MLYFFFECETWTEELRERHNIYLDIMRLAADLGVSFAFPTQSLHVESVATPAPKELPPPANIEELGTVIHAYGPDGEAGHPSGLLITETAYAPGESSTLSADADG